jgi:hypothetical protein
MIRIQQAYVTAVLDIAETEQLDSMCNQKGKKVTLGPSRAPQVPRSCFKCSHVSCCTHTSTTKLFWGLHSASFSCLLYRGHPSIPVGTFLKDTEQVSQVPSLNQMDRCVSWVCHTGCTTLGELCHLFTSVYPSVNRMFTTGPTA